MDTAVSSLIYERFFRELEQRGEQGQELAEELRRLHYEHELHRDARLMEIFQRLAGGTA